MHGMTGLLRSLRLRSRLDEELVANKKKAVVTLRWVLVIAAAYLMLFSGTGWPDLAVSTVVVLLLVSNVAIGRLPEWFVAQAGFDLILLFVDTILLTTGFYFAEAISSDFYLAYFFIIFLAGISENLVSVLVGSVLASAAYLSIAWGGISVTSGGEAIVGDTSHVALRAFFIFAVALFYGFLVERIRLDRESRQVEYVTQLERVNAQLHELVELKQAFVGSVSHELRTPLNAMLGYIDLVREGTVSGVDGPAWTYIDKAYHRGQHLMHLIEELLSFSKISRGQADVRRCRTDLRELMEKVRMTVNAPALAKGLSLHFDVAPNVDWIVTDNAKVIQILLHLVSNAVKFTEHGEVKVIADRRYARLANGWEGPILELVVTDTGPGIAPEQQQVIFEDFRQGDGSLTRRHGGMGLGLSISRGLVELLRGEIDLESAVGKGSTFTVRLPVEDDPDAEAEAGEAEDIEEPRLVASAAAASQKVA